MRLLIAVLFFSATPALAQVEIVKPWSRATPPGASVAAGYLTVRNKGASADRLVAVTSPAAARVETHITVSDGSISRMREVKGYDIPAGASLELKPRGAHLMFVDVKKFSACTPARFPWRTMLISPFWRAAHRASPAPSFPTW